MVSLNVHLGHCFSHLLGGSDTRLFEAHDLMLVIL